MSGSKANILQILPSVAGRWIPAVLASSCLLSSCGRGASANSPGSSWQWRYYGGDEGFTRYAPFDQIGAGNVGRVHMVWERPGIDSTYRAAIGSQPPNRYLNSTPIYVDGTLYAPDGLGFVEAFDPATGATRWVQKPHDDDPETLLGRSTRGLSYWTDGSDRRLVGVRGQYLFELDPESGAAIASFGDDGRVLLTPPGYPRYGWSSGPIVVGDVAIVGGLFGGAGDGGPDWKGRKPDDVRGFDVRTGKLVWTFHVVPREGEPGTETWGNDSWKQAGDLGAWSPLTADEELGYVYLPLSAPTAAPYGGYRAGDNLFANSLVALDAATGKQVWHFQMVHHDVWEYDNVGPPVLGDIQVDGREVHVVMQANKNGFVYVLDRATGVPVWPIPETPVPASDVPGEQLSPTQPIPTRPPAIAQQGLTRDDLIDLTPDLRRKALEIVARYRLGPLYTPPSLVGDSVTGKLGTLAIPGEWGSANWNTGAFDPETSTYYGFAHSMVYDYAVGPRTDPQASLAYREHYHRVPMVEGLPLSRPPWGRITALDMNRGTRRWMVANGTPRDLPADLEELDPPPLGIANRPAPLVTRTLLFLGEGSDVVFGTAPNMWGSAFRAYDKTTGEVVWKTDLPAGTTGGPMSYMHEGKQYIVVAVAGKDHPSEWVALSLP